MSYCFKCSSTLLNLPVREYSVSLTPHVLMNSAERSIVTYINEHEKVVKIDSKIYSQGEGSNSPGSFRCKETARID